MRVLLILLCVALLVAGFSAKAFAADPMSYEIVSSTDLTMPFHTKTKWRFVVTQAPSNDIDSEPGPLFFCFLHEGKPSCPSVVVRSCDYLDKKPSCPRGFKPDNFTQPYNYFGNVAVIYPTKSSKSPLLVVTVSGNYGGPGTPSGPKIWAYRRKYDRFDQIFSGDRSSNTEGEVRLITSGPLAGDVIANNDTGRWPYPYEIMVYKFLRSENYVRILDYNSKAKYRDGNPLKVIDEEMPEIERRMGVWRPGEPLPVPPQMPSSCRTIELHDGIEWCK